jgi:hypothetical protein
MPRGRPRAAAGTLAAAGACGLLVLLSMGCQSGHSNAREACIFKPGMTTDALVGCGCMAANSRSDGAMMLMSEEARNNTRTIAVVNYICPLGSAGVARVAVINGIASNVYE